MLLTTVCDMVNSIYKFPLDPREANFLETFFLKNSKWYLFQTRKEGHWLESWVKERKSCPPSQATEWGSRSLKEPSWPICSVLTWLEGSIVEERHACPAKKLNTDQTAEPRIYYMNLHAHSAIQPKGRRTSSKRKIRIAGETSRSLMERSKGH